MRSIEHGTYLDDESIDLFKEKDAYLVMDLKAAHYDIIESRTGSDESTTDQDPLRSTGKYLTGSTKLTMPESIRTVEMPNNFH